MLEQHHPDPCDISAMKIAKTLLHEECGNHERARARAQALARTCSGMKVEYETAVEALDLLAAEKE